jgi:hypothetical protein
VPRAFFLQQDRSEIERLRSHRNPASMIAGCSAIAQPLLLD